MKKSVFYKTTAFKLSAIFLGVFCLFAVATVGYFAKVAGDRFARDTERAIAREIRDLARQYQNGGLRRLVRHVDGRSRRPGSGIFLVTNPTGERLTGNISAIPHGLSDKDREEVHPIEYTRVDYEGDREKHRAFVRMFDLPAGFKLVVGRDVGERNQFQRVATGYVLVTIAALLIAAALSWFLVGRNVLRRIDDMSATSQKIIAGNLSERLAVQGSGDEFDRLAENVNDMLNRIEHLMIGLKEVSDNIAHDLKTPLTRMRNRVDSALTSDVSVDNYREALEGTIAESDQLIRTFDALLRIARVEAGSTGVGNQQLDAQAVVADMAELYEPAAEEAGVLYKIDLSAEKLPIEANRELLSQALANLLDNAIKYAAAEGVETPKVSISTAIVDDVAEIIVADNGPGIPAEDRERALQRFVRLEKSRSKPGSGLGLSLVSAVAKLMGGKVVLGNNEPGLIAKLCIPISKASDISSAEVKS